MLTFVKSHKHTKNRTAAGIVPESNAVLFVFSLLPICAVLLTPSTASPLPERLPDRTAAGSGARYVPDLAALTELGICPAGQDIHVQLRGGELVIRVLPGRQLLMTGSAVTVYEGVAEV